MISLPPPNIGQRGDNELFIVQEIGDVLRILRIIIVLILNNRQVVVKRLHGVLGFSVPDTMNDVWFYPLKYRHYMPEKAGILYQLTLVSRYQFFNFKQLIISLQCQCNFIGKNH